MPSNLEMVLRWQFVTAGLTDGLKEEFRAIPGRRYRWDFAWPAEMLLLEVQGGVWTKGGHSTGTGITRDAEKANLATLAGFRCLAVTKDHINSGQALKWVQEALRRTK